jgi:putative hydrolase of the HAD superfamily
MLAAVAGARDKRGMASLTAIGFDADDTLWQNEQFFRLTEQRFAQLLGDYADHEHLKARLLEAEKRNLASYGFGIKGFTLSMIETAIEVTEGKVPSTVIARILEAGREMLVHPVETLPEARETLERLAAEYRLILITKGDLFDQERKLAASGLGDLFDAVEIVSDKSRSTYERVFARHAHGAEKSMMVGNSLKSDVVPAIEAGAWGVYIPHELTWVVEHMAEPAEEPRFRRISALGQLAGLVEEIG